MNLRKFRFILVNEDGEVTATNDTALALRACADGATTVIDLEAAVSTFDSSEEPIVEASPDDWPEDEDNEDGDD